jgi:ubiquinone biosynthesis protein Coq4
MMRLRQTHDLWHTLTGFGTSIADELGLQAFTLAQVHSPLAPLLIGSRLVVASLFRPLEAREIISRVCLGWQMGTNAKQIFAIDWESHWQTPLSLLRNEYKISAFVPV